MTVTLVLTLAVAMASLICVQGTSDTPYSVVDYCCSDGAEEGRKGDCTRNPSAGKLRSDKPVCKPAWLTCCLKGLQEQSCKNGAAKAMKEQNCSKDGDSKCDKTTEHVCCSQCMVGIHNARAGRACEPVRAPFDVVSVTCCKNWKKKSGNDNNPCKTSPCSQNCENLGRGRYRCSCRTGYRMKSGGTCEVIDPCKSNPCQHWCYNSGNGKFSCSCPTGQQLNADKRTCKVEDPCRYKYCQHQCKAVRNAAQCFCPEGFTVEGNRCRDIDECRARRNLCNPSYQKCFNTHGSYKCAPNSCPNRYLVKSGGSYCYKKRCRTGDTACFVDKVTSHQWLHSAVRSQVKPDGAVYTYTLSRPSYRHEIRYSIASGNIDDAFYLVRETNYKVVIKNRKTLVGPKDYPLKLVISVYKDGVINSQLTITFYVYVSAYTF